MSYESLVYLLRDAYIPAPSAIVVEIFSMLNTAVTSYEILCMNGTVWYQVSYKSPTIEVSLWHAG